MNKEYYVYGAYGLHGELLYIGYGKGDRYKHCNNEPIVLCIASSRMKKLFTAWLDSGY